MSDRLEEIKEKRSKMDPFDRSFIWNRINSRELDWLIGQVDHYETLIKVIHELAEGHLFQYDPDGKAIPMIHKLTEEPE